MIGGPAPGGRTAVLVGYGPRTTSASRRPRKRAAPAAAPPAPLPPPPIEEVRSRRRPPITDAPSVRAAGARRRAPEPDAPAARAHVLAKPPVRKLAKDLGVDLAQWSPRAAPGGVVTRDDVELRARTAARPDAGVPARRAAQACPGCRAGERETRSRSRACARRPRRRWSPRAFTAPHVSEFVTVDATRTMELVERLRATASSPA